MSLAHRLKRSLQRNPFQSFFGVHDLFPELSFCRKYPVYRTSEWEKVVFIKLLTKYVSEKWKISLKLYSLWLGPAAGNDDKSMDFNRIVLAPYCAIFFNNGFYDFL